MTRNSLTALAFVLLMWVVAFSAAPAAADFACDAPDGHGDVSVQPGQGFAGEPFQDIAASSIERLDGSFVFTMDVAAPIPANPAIKIPNGSLLWMWGMNTGPGVPQGFPLAPGTAGLLEFWIHVIWDGTTFEGELIDRRPALQGGVPLVTPVAFEVAGSRITVIADASLLGDPPTFRWGSSTWLWPTHLGTSGPKVLDRAPDGAALTCPEAP